MEEHIGIEEIKTIPLLDDRQQKECLLAIAYERDFQHGTDGHNRLILIARLVRLVVMLVRQNKHLDEANQGWQTSQGKQRYKLEGERE